jgi:hypothetical protein
MLHCIISLSTQILFLHWFDLTSIIYFGCVGGGAGNIVLVIFVGYVLCMVILMQIQQTESFSACKLLEMVWLILLFISHCLPASEAFPRIATQSFQISLSFSSKKRINVAWFLFYLCRFFRI